MNREPLNIAIIGCGRIAQTYAQVLLQHDACRIAAVADLDGFRAASLARQCACPSYTDYQEVSALERLDAAVICLPPASHFAAAAAFMEKGKHVLCEKPLSVSSLQARQLCRLAQRTKTVLMMAAKFRYVKDMVNARRIVASGLLGEISMLQLRFCSVVDMSCRWHTDPAVAGGGVLMDNGCHALDLVRYLLGPLERVLALEGCRTQSPAVEDTVRIFVRTTGGAAGSIDLSWSLPAPDAAYLSVNGNRGDLKVAWDGLYLRSNDDSAWTKRGCGYNKHDAFAGQVDNFMVCIEGREQPRITADDAVACMVGVEAAYRSLQTNTWQEVSP